MQTSNKMLINLNFRKNQLVKPFDLILDVQDINPDINKH